MEIVLIVAAFVLILLGAVFVFLPGVPGPLVSWLGPFVYFLFTETPPTTDAPAADAAALLTGTTDVAVPTGTTDATSAALSAGTSADAALATLSFIGAGTLAVAFALAVLTIVFDVFSSWLGAVKFGATWRGGVGALIGAFVGPMLFSPLGGIFGALLGLLVGPLVGAIVGELLGRRSLLGSARAGWGTLLGALAATAVKLFYCFAVFVWFAAELIW